MEVGSAFAAAFVVAAFVVVAVAAAFVVALVVGVVVAAAFVVAVALVVAAAFVVVVVVAFAAVLNSQTADSVTVVAVALKTADSVSPSSKALLVDWASAAAVVMD